MLNIAELKKENYQEYAMFMLSLSWKVNSRFLFLKSQNFEEFKFALEWCGTHGNVIRTVEVGYFNNFAEFIFGNINLIRSGHFNLLDVPKFGKDTPLSFVSKICHIINPKSYPLIYDSRLRDTLKVGSLSEYVEKVTHVSKSIHFHRKSMKFAYQFDSAIWAFGQKFLHKVKI